MLMARTLLELSYVTSCVASAKAIALTSAGRPVDDARLARQLLTSAARELPPGEAARATAVLRRVQRSVATEMFGQVGRHKTPPQKASDPLAEVLARFTERHIAPAMTVLACSMDLHDAFDEVVEVMQPCLDRAVSPEEQRETTEALERLIESLRGSMVAA